MSLTPDVRKCASPDCETAFLKLGQGTLTVFSVEEPGLLGLPPHLRQKVVWLCDKCAAYKYVHYDRQHHRIRVLEARGRGRRPAA